MRFEKHLELLGEKMRAVNLAKEEDLRSVVADESNIVKGTILFYFQLIKRPFRFTTTLVI